MSVLKCEASSGERMSGVREEEVVYPEQLAWILKEGGKQAAGFSLSAPAGALKECLILKLPPPPPAERDPTGGLSYSSKSPISMFALLKQSCTSCSEREVS